MISTASLFSSPAKARVLRAMVWQEKPLPLRQIAYLSEAPLFSVQRALDQLVREKLLSKKKKGPFVLFSLNKKGAPYSFLKQVFELEMKVQVAETALGYCQKAGAILRFADSALRLIHEARS